jgi:hypothetical protein
MRYLAMGVVTAVMMGAMSNLNAQIQATGLPGEGIALQSAHDAGFAHTLEKISPGLISRADFAPHLAQSVMIQNKSPHSIAGYALQWKITTQSGKVLTHNQEYLEPPAFDVGQRLRYGILPQTFSLVSPYYTWNATMLKGLANATSARPVPNEGFSKSLQEAASVSVALDGVFYEDGSFVGPDNSLFFEHVQHQLASRRQIAQFVSTAISRGQNAESLAAALTAKVNSGANINAMTPNDNEMSQLYDSYEARFFLQYANMKRMDIVTTNATYRLAEQTIAVFKK